MAEMFQFIMSYLTMHHTHILLSIQFLQIRLRIINQNLLQMSKLGLKLLLGLARQVVDSYRRIK